MSRLRVTLVNKFFLPVDGGVERHVFDLMEGLEGRAEIEQLNVLVAGTTRQTEVEKRPKGQLVRLPTLGRLASAPLSDFRRGLRALPADIYHFHFPNPPGELSWLALGRAPGKLVVTYHSDIVRQWYLLPLLGPFIRRFLRQTNCIITTSPILAETSSCLRGMEQKIRTVPLGIRTERFEPTPELLARAASLRAQWGTPCTLFVGRMVYYKGLPVLLRAMQGLPGTVVMAGDGPMRRELEQQARRLHLRANFLGQVADCDLPGIYRAADVVVLPSTHRSEAFGLVQLEAHASAVPVVSTSLPTGVPWVNPHGETGLVVRPGDAKALHDALAFLLTHEQERRTMGIRAAQRVREFFGLAGMIEHTLSVYREVLEHG